MGVAVVVGLIAAPLLTVVLGFAALVGLVTFIVAADHSPMGSFSPFWWALGAVVMTVWVATWLPEASRDAQAAAAAHKAARKTAPPYKPSRKVRIVCAVLGAGFGVGLLMLPPPNSLLDIAVCVGLMAAGAYIGWRWFDK